jgi:putative oxidoreductase
MAGDTPNAAVGRHGSRSLRHRPARAAITDFATRVLSIIIPAVLVKSSLAHLSNPYSFLAAVYSYRLLARNAGLALSVISPFLQLSVAVCLISRTAATAAFGTGALLMGAFSVAQASAIVRGLDVKCGCFGSTSGQVGSASLVFSAAMCFLCAIGCISNLRRTPRI